MIKDILLQIAIGARFILIAMMLLTIIGFCIAGLPLVAWLWIEGYHFFAILVSAVWIILMCYIVGGAGTGGWD